MGLETGTYINDLNVANPVHLTDDFNAGDDHLRLIKTTLKNSLPGQNFPVAFLIGAGSANTYTGSVSMPTALTGYVNGMEAKLTIPAENTGPSTFNLNSLGAKAIKNVDGSALGAKQLLLNSIAHLIFSTTLDAFLLIGGGASPAVASNPGESYFKFVSATQCAFVPFRGNRVMIKTSGVWQSRTIPSAGITISNGGLTTSTTYRIYLFDNAGTLTLEASTTGHAVDTDTGVEIKSGDATRTLVGLIETNASSQFVLPQVISWYNKRQRIASASLVSNTLISATPFVTVSTTTSVRFCNWADHIVDVEAKISAFAGASGAAGIYCGIGLDTTLQVASLAGLSYHNVPAGGYYEHATARYRSAPATEGGHATYLTSGVVGGASMTANAGYAGVVVSFEG